MKKYPIRHLVTFSACLALVVVMIGAYTRLTNAGLGCPDWPGCYGHIMPVNLVASGDASKAWTEMIHRYVAGTLALSIFIIGGYLISQRRYVARNKVYLAIGLMGLVVFQALLGMWTVTLKLLPIVVMSHLLGGILIFSGLCLLRCQLSNYQTVATSNYIKWINLGCLLVFIQIALGGWVSANYAGLACVGFPQCNGHWLPSLNFSDGFYLFSRVGENYQGGVLENSVRATIQFIHRLGAIIVFVYIVSLGTTLILTSSLCSRALRNAAIIAMVLVIVQFLLGILNVVYLLPLHVAVAHNGTAALLMATLLTMVYLGRRNYG